MRNAARTLGLGFTVLTLAGAGCGGAVDSGGGDTDAGRPSAGGTGGSGGGASRPSAGGTGGSGGGVSPPSGGATPSPSTVPPQSGLLTAGSWDDNLNFDFWKHYSQGLSNAELPGLPPAALADRLVVQVTDQTGAPLAGARVSIISNDRSLLTSITGGDGRVLVFPGWIGVEVGATLQITGELAGAIGSATARPGEMVKLALARPPAAVTGLDVAIVIDTTGSMGDEISYLASELLNISDAIEQHHPGIDQRWAFVAYKDTGDEYVTRASAFTDDIAQFRSAFGKLTGGGGGDYQEAPERGLADAGQLTWRQGAVARLVFWVGDAPHHNANGGQLLIAVRGLLEKGVHVYPVSASGTDELLEYSMRMAALVTGGRYLFLTDDSGIGGTHKEPTVPCYVVTTLQKAMQRMIQMELTGARVEPVPADILRSVGSPQEGRCLLGDGQEVAAL